MALNKAKLNIGGMSVNREEAEIETINNELEEYTQIESQEISSLAVEDTTNKDICLSGEEFTMGKLQLCHKFSITKTVDGKKGKICKNICPFYVDHQDGKIGCRTFFITNKEDYKETEKILYEYLNSGQTILDFLYEIKGFDKSFLTEDGFEWAMEKMEEKYE